MRITETKINGIQNPMGFIYDFMLCSWKVEDTESKKQVHAKIEVSEDADFTRILWEKEGEDLKQSGEKIDLELKPRTTYYYRVTVTGDQGDTAVSDFAYLKPENAGSMGGGLDCTTEGGCLPSGDRHEVCRSETC